VPYDEFPHTVEVVQKRKVSAGAGGFKTEWFPVDTIVILIYCTCSMLLYFMFILTVPQKVPQLKGFIRAYME